MRICALGQYDPEYPRHALILRGLRAQGVEVIECNCRGSALTRTSRKRWLLSQASACPDLDLIYLPAFCTSYAGVARAVSRRLGLPLVYDAFVSLYDTRVHDRGIARPWSARGLSYWLRDWRALHAAHHLLTDTAAHRCYLAAAFRIPPDKVSVIPVGADEALFGGEPWPPPARDCTSVLFYGTHLPLHGVDTIVRAAAALDGREPVRVTIVGSGDTEQAVHALVARLKPSNLRLAPPVPYAQLPDLIRAADICLGIFGTTGKAGRVIPNKIHQALMMGRPVVTRDSPAVREFFVPGEHLLVCEPGEPEALAATLAELARDRPRQLRLAREGRALARARFTSAAIGAAAFAVLERVCGSEPV